MTTTNHMGITLLEQSQSQKEITVNQALAHIDALMNTAAKSRTTSVPPGSPAAGDVYIIGSAPSGDWASNAGDITYYDQTWKFIAPNEGMTLWVEDESLFVTYDGINWQTSIVVDGASYIRSVWVPASDMLPSITSGCATLAQAEILAGQPDLLTLDFDAATEEYAQFCIAMPERWDEGTVTAVLYWSHAATTTNFAVVWGVQAVSVGNDDGIGTAFGAAQEITDTGGTTNDLYVTAATSAITLAGTPAAGDMCCYRIYRKAADGADTLAIDARLHGIRLYITENSYKDV
ncbi:MAG: DUF2793 domain-containing protein [Alphaproteobacteria bacterium]